MSSIDHANQAAARRQHQRGQRPGSLTPRPANHRPRRDPQSTQALVDAEIEAWARRAARSSGFGAPEAGWPEDS
jgi:hypothetical protein